MLLIVAELKSGVAHHVRNAHIIAHNSFHISLLFSVHGEP